VPSMVGRLHPTHGTPYVLIGAAALLAAALSIPRDLEFMLGLYAFGALLAFTLAHASVCALRFREPDRERPYRIPLSIRMGSGDLPLSAALGAGLAGAAWIAVIVLHEGAREAGTVWMLVGLTLYVTYRRTEGKPLLGRVTIPERALREEAARVGYASILVPVLGTDLDDDIIQTAARLAGDEPLEEGEEEEEGATIEALWVFEMPLTLPLDGRVSETDLERARAARRRAREVGEYHGVHVATATARARQAGQAIVEQARRRGVQAIVLAAEEPSRIRGGALLGGRGGPPDDHVGAATRYVVDKAPCRVILTAPPAASEDAAGAGRGRGRRRSRPSPRPSPLGRATGSSPAAGDPID
jgi:basic amino acid/polyamine antiporter, APA family